LNKRLQQGLRAPLFKPAAAVLVFAAVTIASAFVARWAMFVVTQPFEDEGYMLTVLHSFVNHGQMYDDVFGQYGPFYYDFWGGIFSVFGIPLTPDAGRVVVSIVWIVTSLGAGLAALRITKSILLGLATQMAVFSSLSVLANEPMHPVGLIGLLLVGLLAAAAFVGRRLSIVAVAIVGGAVGALLLVKINVGAFALLALALVCVVVYPVLAARRWLRPLVEAFFVVAPLLLMTSKFGEASVRHYAVHVAIAALAVVIALRALRPIPRSNEELGWMIGGLLGVIFASCLALLGSGTSPGGLLYGVIRQPLRQTDSFRIPLELAGRFWYLDALALAGAVAFYWLSRRRATISPGFLALASAISIGVGFELALSVIGRTLPSDVNSLAGYQFAFLAFAWVGLLPLSGRDDSDAMFVKLLLPPLAVLQALHAFPVAGSQTMLATFLLIPLGAVCVANGTRGLARVVIGQEERRAFVTLGGLAAVALLVFLAGVTLRDPLRASRAAYDAEVPLGLPGEVQVRVPPETATADREVTAAINRNCGSFLTMPGMDYFYIWTQQEPPTGYNATAWMTLFDDAHQRRVIDDTRSIRGLCLLRNMGLAEGWSQGPVPPGPLVSYLEDGFRPVTTVGPYELLRREGAASSPS